jgi:hypothetical protein
MSCQCVYCDVCKGTGSMWVDTGSYPEEELEPCEWCDGGISETCSECEQVRWDDADGANDSR